MSTFFRGPSRYFCLKGQDWATRRAELSHFAARMATFASAIFAHRRRGCDVHHNYPLRAVALSHRLLNFVRPRTPRISQLVRLSVFTKCLGASECLGARTKRKPAPFISKRNELGKAPAKKLAVGIARKNYQAPPHSASVKNLTFSTSPTTGLSSICTRVTSCTRRLPDRKTSLSARLKLVNSARYESFACAPAHSSGINNSPRAVCG